VPLTVLATRGHPAGYLVGGVLGALAGVVAGAGTVPLVLGLVCAALAWPAWLGHRSRRQWWPRLAGLVGEHHRAEGRVVEVRAVSDYPPRLRTTVATPEVPGPDVDPRRADQSPGAAGGGRPGGRVVPAFRPGGRRAPGVRGRGERRRADAPGRQRVSRRPADHGARRTAVPCSCCARASGPYTCTSGSNGMSCVVDETRAGFRVATAALTTPP
jgi:hypothetical protein